jgi:hypothetical protein
MRVNMGTPLQQCPSIPIDFPLPHTPNNSVHNNKEKKINSLFSPAYLATSFLLSYVIYHLPRSFPPLGIFAYF